MSKSLCLGMEEVVEWISQGRHSLILKKLTDYLWGVALRAPKAEYDNSLGESAGLWGLKQRE